MTVLRLDGAGLFAMAGGPWLAWLPVELLGRLSGGLVRPLPVEIGRYRYRTGFVARRAAEDLAPFRTLEQAVRDIGPGAGCLAGRLGCAGRSLTALGCQWLPLSAGRRMSRDSHPVPLHSPPLRPGAPDTPEGFADCNAVRSAPQPGPACC